MSVYSRFLTHAIDSLGISPHALTTFAQPGRLRVIESILKFPSIAALYVVRFADDRRVCLDADDDFCYRFRGLPVQIVLLECADLVESVLVTEVGPGGQYGRLHRIQTVEKAYNVSCHLALGYARTDCGHSDLKSRAQKSAKRVKPIMR